MAQTVNISDIKIDCFADKTVKHYTEAIADPAAKFGLGNAAASTAAEAAALALRAVRKTASEDEAMKKAEADLEKLRAYFVHLLDEESKARLPLEKRLRENAPENEVEAGYRTACMILDEVLYTAIALVELINSVADKICPCTAALCAAAVLSAKNAMELARLQLADYSTKMIEEVYARTTRREPEIAIEGSAKLTGELIAKLEAMIK